jgi:hypothetical protein
MADDNRQSLPTSPSLTRSGRCGPAAGRSGWVRMRRAAARPHRSRSALREQQLDA